MVAMSEDQAPLPLEVLGVVLALTICFSSLYFHVYLHVSRWQPQAHPQARDSVVQMFYQGSTWRTRRAFLEEKSRAAARWMFINAKRTRWSSQQWEMRNKKAETKKK